MRVICWREDCSRGAGYRRVLILAQRRRGAEVVIGECFLGRVIILPQRAQGM